MKPAELTKIRERLKLNQAGLAAELNVQRSTVSRWESGEVEMPKVAELAVRYLLVTRRDKTKPKRKRPVAAPRTPRRT